MSDQHIYKYDATENDSLKSWLVPARSDWHLDGVWVKLVSTGSAGNRLMKVDILDASSNVVSYGVAGAVQVASNTYYYYFSPEMPNETAFSSSCIRNPIFDGWLKPGFTVKVWDSAGIAPTADDMTVALFITQRDVLS